MALNIATALYYVFMHKVHIISPYIEVCGITYDYTGSVYPIRPVALFGQKPLNGSSEIEKSGSGT